MKRRVLEAVPNFSEGRDLAVVGELVDAIEAAGADVLDWSADADHHRSVVTLVGEPDVVEDAVLAAAAVAVDAIDLGRHEGVHPRIGAVDVVPFVPLVGLEMDDARAVARRAGRRLADELEIPVYFYRDAAEPRGRPLGELRRGGFEALVDGWPDGRRPDALPDEWQHPGVHPTAGATCVGARGVLLAWNVYVTGITPDDAAGVARMIRESDGGFKGVRALALELPRRGGVQISMNLEDLETTSPMDVYRTIERLTGERGGATAGTEVIGLIPDELLETAASDRLRLLDPQMRRTLSRGLVRHLSELNGTRAAPGGTREG